MEGLITRALGPGTWDAYAALIDAHKGVWGGCWCLAFHGDLNGGSYDERREKKRRLVAAGETHAALVFDGDRCVGWAQFGATAELPRLPNRKAYEAGDTGAPDWRIPCFFVDRGYRRQGVAAQALAAAGGGVVEAVRENTEGRKASASFLWYGTVAMFERAGFTAVRQIGKHRWVARRTIEGTTP